MTLAPSEYTGESGTCVCGRVVGVRGPFQPERRDQESQADSSKGKGKGKKGKNQGQTGQDRLKTEIHILGGHAIDEVLFIEGWADGARQLAEALPRGGVYRIADAKKVEATPRFSTSRLSYYLRFVPPIGVNTKIAIYTENPWADLPLHHPFVDFESLKRVEGSLRVCLVGVVSTQPGSIARDTKFGQSRVCNAVLKQRSHLIRCGFWRDHGDALATHPVGAALALHQVTVYFKNGGWEVAATEATVIEECPAEAKASLLAETDLTVAGVSLTQAARVDYNTAKTIPATLSGLNSVLQPQQARDLNGVFEVHGVAVLGVSSVLRDNTFSMRACKKCKAQVSEAFDVCQVCTDSDGLENRWIFSLDLADQGGSATAMLYHDVAQDLAFLEEAAASAKIIRGFKAPVWSLRLIYKKNEMKHNNYLEIKKIGLTITADGVLSSFRKLPKPHTVSQSGCPFAFCSEVTFDKDLGVLTRSGTAVSAARLLVRVKEAEEDELIAQPDPTNNGFRVCRRIRCCLAGSSADAIYDVKIAGMAASVQWLMTASPDSCFLVTVKGRAADKAFTVLAHLPVKAEEFKQYEDLLLQHISHKEDVEITHLIADTPKKRLQTLQSAVPEASTPPPFDKRQKLTDA